MVKVPNISNIYYGRTVGYKFNKINLSKEITRISATKIRKELRELVRLDENIFHFFRFFKILYIIIYYEFLRFLTLFGINYKNKPIVNFVLAGVQEVDQVVYMSICHLMMKFQWEKITFFIEISL